jgi:EEF1A lysine methyltransferase 1
VYYDFNKADELSKDLHGYFDMVVIDPPFITREVWEKYAECAKMILKPTGGMYLISTIDENEAMIKELTGCDRQTFRPSIPNLVYQYSFYANYEHPGLKEKNPEIPDF